MKVKIYTSNWCAYCIAAKNFFDEHNIRYKEINIETFEHNHGNIDVQTYRIDNFAYSTDIKNFYENDIDKLKNLDLWIVGLLRNDPHPSHAGFDQIIEYINYIKPKINTESIFRLLSPILQIFFGIPNSKKFKTDIHENMKNHKINELESLFLQFIKQKEKLLI